MGGRLRLRGEAAIHDCLAALQSESTNGLNPDIQKMPETPVATGVSGR
ncbi:hypothetical protein HMP0721_1354 [Pseudoramibacter alactolyticus ATCC 23263]|uniref:Uncharacterized protein n=1 Tax=Pseudoramibacter alactolyticus ATCC 23263 TaxID=887929 RepID=E6MH69_9FIRM|nr:hypothetical protein HMP0721_1354 [Pseudoramibacter alactolyticus ATCC 23263]